MQIIKLLQYTEPSLPHFDTGHKGFMELTCVLIGIELNQRSNGNQRGSHNMPLRGYIGKRLLT